MIKDFFEKHKEMIKKLGITLLILTFYRLGMFLIIPGVNTELLKNCTLNTGILKTLNMLVGGGIEKCSLFTINIMPYISATIITQFLSSRLVGFQYFQSLKQNRELGSAKLNSWTQFFALAIAIIQATYISSFIFNVNDNGLSAVFISKSLFMLISVPIMVTGTFITIWISNQISKYGVGQGTSIIIFVNIILSSETGIMNIYRLYKAGILSIGHIMFIVGFIVTLFTFVIFIESCRRLIPVQYPGIANKSSSQVLPLKINNAGVIPPVLASSLAYMPQLIGTLLKKIFYTENLDKYLSYFSHGGIFYYAFMSLLLFVLTMSQTEIVFDPQDVAQGLQDSGVVVTGIRPGKDTVSFLRKTITKLNVLAGIYLAIACVFSEYICNSFNNMVHTKVLHLSGTSVLILTSTAQLIFKGSVHYDYNKTINKLKHNTI